MKILLIRHGATAGNLEHRYIGRTDEHLCPLGVQQMIQLKQLNLTAERLFVSPAVRTRQSAQILFPDMACIPVPELWETDFGAFEGKNAQELKDDPQYVTWVLQNCRAPIPGGEAVEQFKKRCCLGFFRCLQEADASSAAFVIHGGVIMAILERYAVPSRDFYSYHIANGEMVEYTWSEKTQKLTKERILPVSE